METIASSQANDKFVQYLNETLATENAAEARLQSRIQETSVDKARQQMQYHLQQTRQQQSRLKQIISDLGSTPTVLQARLPGAPSQQGDGTSVTPSFPTQVSAYIRKLRQPDHLGLICRIETRAGVYRTSIDHN